MELEEGRLMATTWYFRNTNETTGPTSKASPDTDAFPSVPSDKNTPKQMLSVKGTGQTSVSGAYATTANCYTLARIFVSPPLAAQTLTGGQTGYKIGIAIKESNTSMNLYHRAFVYIWRSGSGNVKTIISPTSCGTEHGTSETGCVITATGASGDFFIQAGDRIVVEEWWDIRNTKNTSYTATYYWDGTTDVVESTATSNAAGFFYCPQTLTLLPTQKTFSLDTYLKRVAFKTYTMDAALKGAKSKTVSLDSALSTSKSVSSSIDTLLSLKKIKSMDIDSALYRRQLKIAQLDSALSKGVSKDIPLDVTLSVSRSILSSIDALLSTKRTKAMDIDAALSKSSLKTTQFDASLVKTILKNVLSDAALSAASYKTFSIGAVLKETSSREFQLDSVLQKTLFKALASDSVLKKTKQAEFGLDAVLEATMGVEKTKYLEITSVLSKLNVTGFDLDTLLVKRVKATFLLDAYLSGEVKLPSGGVYFIPPRRRTVILPISITPYSIAKEIRTIEGRIALEHLSFRPLIGRIVHLGKVAAPVIGSFASSIGLSLALRSTLLSTTSVELPIKGKKSYKLIIDLLTEDL